MKIRKSFVSNSSSSSFVISKRDINKKQIKIIKNHIQYDIEKNLGCGVNDDELNFQWDITEDNESIKGYVFMDNFDMERFLYIIGIDDKNIKWVKRS